MCVKDESAPNQLSHSLELKLKKKKKKKKKRVKSENDEEQRKYANESKGKDIQGGLDSAVDSYYSANARSPTDVTNLTMTSASTVMDCGETSFRVSDEPGGHSLPMWSSQQTADAGLSTSVCSHSDPICHDLDLVTESSISKYKKKKKKNEDSMNEIVENGNDISSSGEMSGNVSHKKKKKEKKRSRCESENDKKTCDMPTNDVDLNKNENNVIDILIGFDSEVCNDSHPSICSGKGENALSSEKLQHSTSHKFSNPESSAQDGVNGVNPETDFKSQDLFESQDVQKSRKDCSQAQTGNLNWSLDFSNITDLDTGVIDEIADRSWSEDNTFHSSLQSNKHNMSNASSIIVHAEVHADSSSDKDAPSPSQDKAGDHNEIDTSAMSVPASVSMLSAEEMDMVAEADNQLAVLNAAFGLTRHQFKACERALKAKGWLIILFNS